jgi:uncharacterized protein YdbL (DUF1318 family)
MSALVKRLGSLWLSPLLCACVTINIYFPSAQAKEAAEKIVEDILQAVPAQPAPQAPAPAPDSGALVPDSGSSFGMGGVLEFLLPAAHAAQPNFSVDSPEVRRIQASLKQRAGALSSHLRSGAVGLTNDGLVTLRDPGAVSLRDRKAVQQLVAQDNRERSQLYQAIARANGHPEWEPDIRKVFSATWVEKAEPGWWYQTPTGQWRQK